MLRSRQSRREEPLDAARARADRRAREDGADPEHEALLADSVGLALLVVLETLTPAERLAFVLHDMFAVPFDEIAPIVDRSPGRRAPARQPRPPPRAGRRTRRPTPTSRRQREVVDAFLAAARDGDFDALLAVLDPDVVLRADGGSAPPGVAAWSAARDAVAGAGARCSRSSRPFVRPALVNGAAGVVVAPTGRPFSVMGFTVGGGRIVEIDVARRPRAARPSST